MIIADTGAIVALVDADDQWHERVRTLFEADPDRWILPWAVLPEVDCLLGAHVGRGAQEAFHDDVADGVYVVEWGTIGDLARARELHRKYKALKLGLVDGVVVAVAERLRARAIATIDLRHFGALAIRGRPRLLPRDT
ncbi:MAG: type II toxin-antitoxin system VapC family toxin [Polyangiaceae bacterium]